MKAERDRTEQNVVRDVWVVNNTRLDAAAGAYFFVFDISADSNGQPYQDAFIRVKNLHLANNLIARTTTSASTNIEGVRLDDLPVGSRTWANELTQQLGDGSPGSRWWVSENVWMPGVGFTVDSISKTLSQWNSLNIGTGRDDIEVSGGMLVDAAYRPTTSSADIGHRLVYGAPAMEVAGYDYYGKRRPASSVTAGAVERNPLT